MKKSFAILRYVLTIHVLGILFFTLFRIIFYFVNSSVFDVQFNAAMFFKAMQRGLVFDNLIASHISLLPLIFLSIFALFNKMPKALVIICSALYILIYPLAISISIADIPYFSFFYSHIGVSAFDWFAFGKTTFGLIFQETRNYPYFALILIAVVSFIFLTVFFTKKLLKTTTTATTTKNLKLLVPLTIVIWGFCFLGIRSSIYRYPLRVGYAYFSNSSFYNQLGANSTFFMMKSLKGLKKQNTVADIMNFETALTNTQKILDVTEPELNSPLLRNVEPDGNQLNVNVVIILLESMASNYLSYEYNGEKITPYINDLIEKSYYFENFYSAGIHTNMGIAATLYGYPPLFKRPMMEVEVTHYTGLPYALHKQGYKNMFFVTSSPQYDNMNVFFYENNFDCVYSQNDYPDSKVVNSYGVQDDYLFEYGLEKLNDAAKNDNPFFAVFMTVSNHQPYIVPEEFKNEGNTAEECMVAYTDKCLQKFMQDAEKQKWGKNTLFVILGDHGRTLGQQKYAMPLSYNHIPCIIYSPLLNDTPKRFKQFGGQIDVYPTVAGLLNIPHANNSLGIDLLKDKQRPCMFFVNDNQLGCINDNYFYVRDLITKSDILYDLHNANSSDNIFDKNLDAAEHLKNYSVSMMVTAEYMLKNKVNR
ncbi:MAG: sulfatase-like hydrolase/transferase [Prevotellaceae bacterium]|jgi:phosphoglycerol transferase MdoB-like AlkP superfamily enzyme|nr:sulfatase-like hydrolase/transferase [Prevotellaceae bacterium]